MPATAAISYTAESFDTATERLMGRHAAGEAFLEAMVRHASDEPLYCLANSKTDFAHFDRQVAAVGNPAARTRHIPRTEPERLSEPGCLFIPNPMLAAPAFQRRPHGAARYSLCGITHTVASHQIMDGLGAYLTAPLEPWDALICTSRCVRSVVRAILESQAAYIEERLGVRPAAPLELPVIPLGVECDRLAKSAGAAAARANWRAQLGISEADIAALFFGRLSYHAKANPAPMFLGLEAAQCVAPRGSKVCLILAGWFANDTLERGFREAAAALCPSIEVKLVDGRTKEARDSLWHAADLFVSLSDNIQETFGLTPIEAMAAGLPVVVSDWDGYRDTVVHGETGFLIPTVSAPAGSGPEIAVRHASGLDSYDRYVGNASLCTVVDGRATASVLSRLIGDSALRAKMGEAAAAHARRGFDWRVVIEAYRTLWAELSARRHAATPEAMSARTHPLRPDPFALFEGFPSATLSPRHRVRWLASSAAEAEHRLGLGIANYAPHLFLAPHLRATLFGALQGDATMRVSDLQATGTYGAPALMRTLLWLAKFGVIAIEDGGAT